MSAPKLALTRDISAPVADVWHVLTDISSAADTLTGVSAVEMLTEGPYAVGTRWRETREVMGKAVTEEMWVAETDEPRSTVVRAESRGAAYVTAFRLAPIDTGTRLTMEFGGEMTNPGLVMRILGPLTSRLGLAMSRKMVAQDLADIAAAAERRARP